MSLKAGVDFEGPSRVPISQITPAWLGPVAKAVWDACADFNPTLTIGAGKKAISAILIP
jgi:hypothetical protein